MTLDNKVKRREYGNYKTYRIIEGLELKPTLLHGLVNSLSPDSLAKSVLDKRTDKRTDGPDPLCGIEQLQIRKKIVV